MLLIKIPKNRMNYLIEQVQSHYRTESLERGWEYYHKGRVHHLDLSGGLELTADVAGKSTIYRVGVNLEKFDESDCSCSLKEPCPHIAAVFFAAYSAHGRPELLLMQLRTTIATRMRTQKSAAQKQARTKEKAAAVEPDNLPREWQKFFDQRFHGYTLTQQHSIELFVSMTSEKLLPFAEGWPEPLRRLYELHIVWFALRKIESFAEQNQSSYLSFHFEQSCRAVVDQCWKKLAELVVQIDGNALARNYSAHWNETLAMASEAIGQPRTETVSWLSFYRYLWWKLFAGVSGVQAEADRLEQRIAAAPGPSRKRDQLVQARAFFDVMQGDDEAAAARYDEQLQAKILPEFYDVLEYLRAAGDWRRLQLWLRWLLPALGRARQDEFQAVSAYWEDAVAHLEGDAEWVQAMRALLPRSYPRYSAYLLGTGRLREWVDLLLSYGLSPSQVASDDLRKVEAAEPRLLLPLYHIAVEKAVLEKNRNSYQEAIRFLKKLQALYRKLDQPELWSVYMQRLVHKFARLRAFQEELKKGKWAP